MMLNSITRYKRLLLALLCGSMSYSALAKVYSWRDAGGAMHYSQFPRQIVEKNAAQSKASRKEADMGEVVKDLSSSKEINLLDGLDDIVANANAERQAEKVLKRRDPELLLIEQQLVRQQAAQRALLVAKQAEQEKQNALIAANKLLTEKPIKLRPTKDNFMAGIHKRAYGNEARVEEKIEVSAEPTQVAAVSAEAASLPKVHKSSNKFLAGIQHKLKRNNNPKPASDPRNESVIIENIAKTESLFKSKLESNPQQLSQLQVTNSVQDRVLLTPAPNYILDPIAPLDASSMMLAVDSSLEDSRLVENSLAEQKAVSKPAISYRPTRDVRKKKPTNAFLAGIKNKLNRQSDEHKVDEEVLVANQLNPSSKSNFSAKSKSRATPEEVQNKFLAEINKKLFRAHLATDTRGTNTAPASELVKSSTVINTKKPRPTTVKNKELIQGADQIKAIENEISSSNQPSKVQAPSTKQVNSALMLSRLSYNHNARLPLSGAGTNQLDRQGINVSSQFVHDVTSSAE